MKAQIWSYNGDFLIDCKNVEIPDDFDITDPYGGSLGFALGSNQIVVIDQDSFIKNEALEISQQEIDKYLTEGMGIPYLKATEFYYEHRPWEYFGLLWEWSQQQEWWNAFGAYIYHFMPTGNQKAALTALEWFVHPRRFAMALYKFLKEAEK